MGRICKLHTERPCPSRESNPGPSWESNPGPSCCEATVLTTAPPIFMEHSGRMLKMLKRLNIWF
ncbi:hypothetical protein LDENG_00075560 [Lucifuga dentata]|nr:hypothetical protein LDENG_00075560 [Lucifuga dentata]